MIEHLLGARHCCVLDLMRQVPVPLRLRAVKQLAQSEPAREEPTPACDHRLAPHCRCSV